MPADRDRRHLPVDRPPGVEGYKRPARAVPSQDVPGPADRKEHGRSLARSLEMAAQEAKERRKRTGVSVHDAETGLYVEIESPPGIQLNLDGLENRQGKSPIALLTVSVSEADDKDDVVQTATVFIPERRLGTYLKKFKRYAEEKTSKGEPKHKDLVDRIQAIGLATLEALWTDEPNDYPEQDTAIWWEVWLRKSDDKEYERFLEFSQAVGIKTSAQRLQFDDRLIVLTRATPSQLASGLDALGDMAELRRAKQSAAPFDCMAATEQAEWMRELANRTAAPGEQSPAVCILDTGVNRGHPLLSAAIDEDDIHAVVSTWGADDRHGHEQERGHGTAMAGLAIYGNLAPLLATSEPVTLHHCVESVKILPPRGHKKNDPALYGTVTATATNRVEIQAPKRPRCFSMSVTAPEKGEQGKPTSWSAAVDALAAGRSFVEEEQGLLYTSESERAARRLFIVSAGNVSRFEADHLAMSDLSPIEDPGQSWNALTVGACTDLANIQGQDWSDWTPVAKPGDLSPHSRTSVLFKSPWPIKPDVVFEGGNAAKNPHEEIETEVPDLCLLTTHHDFAERSFTRTNATSAATAQVARMAAMLRADYPEFWVETIRGLIVHSARWTETMLSSLGKKANKRQRKNFVRRYGFGVPSLARAARSATDALTLVAQSTIRPFDSQGRYQDMHIHDLPWPRDELASLGEASVRLRLTLSYFVEPNPGRRGWRKRYGYASHGLRFQIKRPTEDREAFRKRVNAQALAEGEKRETVAGEGSKWFLGTRTSELGSLHSNIWTGTAADLAERNVIAVYPVAGWWKAQPKKNRSHLGAPYSLLITLETPESDVDIWTPVANRIGVSTTVEPLMS